MAGEKLEDDLIREFSAEDDLDKVELLVLRGLGLKDVSALRRVSSLTSLSLSHNCIESIDLPANVLPHLTELNVNNNMLTSLTWINCCPKIEKLYASCNKIRELDPLARCESLEFVGLHGNNIEDLASSLKVLKGLLRLKDLEMDGNKCAAGNAYRHLVIDNLQQILRLDGTSILSEDREKAKNILKFNQRQTSANSQQNRTTQPEDVGSKVKRSAASKDDDLCARMRMMKESFLSGHIQTSTYLLPPADPAGHTLLSSSFLTSLSARRPATSHQNAVQYRLSNANISTDARQLSKVLAAKSSEYLQGSQESMLADLTAASEQRPDSQMFKVTENAAFLNSNPILLEYLAEAAADEEEGETVQEGQEDDGEKDRLLQEKTFVSDDIMFVDSSASRANGSDHRSGFDRHQVSSSSMRAERPSSRRRGGFANELRKVTSAMSAVEEFSIEQIAEIMNKAKSGDSHSLGEILNEFVIGTADRSSPLDDQHVNNKSNEMIIRRLLKTIDKLQNKITLLESGIRTSHNDGNVNIDSLKKEIAALRIENTNMYHLREENVSLRKQLTEIHERWDENKLREQNSRLKTQVKHYKAQCQRLREESANFGRPMTSAGLNIKEEEERETRGTPRDYFSGIRARENRETDTLLAEVDEYDSELAELVRRNVAMLSEIQEDIQELQSVSDNDRSQDKF